MLGDEIEDVVRTPHGGIRLGDVQITEADRAISRDFELQIVAGREVHFGRGVHRSKDQFLDERGDVAIADDAQLDRSGCTRARAAGTIKIQEKPTVAGFQRIGAQTAANWGAGG